MAPSLLSACPHVFQPLTVIIALTSVFGVLGNSLAFYIFHFRYTPSGFNTLLAALAVFDVIACLIHMPLDIATFSDMSTMRATLCKITCFQLAFTATGSAVILLVIAIIRHSAISNPVPLHFATRTAYHMIVVSVLLAAGIALPITMLFGTGNIVVPGNITVEICAVEEKFMHTKGPLAYYYILTALYVVTFIALSSLYGRSMYKLWRSKRMFVSFRGRDNVIMMSPPTARSNKSRPVPSPRVSVLREQAATHGRDRTDSGNSRGKLVPDLDSDCSANEPVHLVQAEDNSDRVVSVALPTDSSMTESSDDIAELNTNVNSETIAEASSTSPEPSTRPIPASRTVRLHKDGQTDATSSIRPPKSSGFCSKRSDNSRQTDTTSTMSSQSSSLFCCKRSFNNRTPELPEERAGTHKDRQTDTASTHSYKLPSLFCCVRSGNTGQNAPASDGPHGSSTDETTSQNSSRLSFLLCCKRSDNTRQQSCRTEQTQDNTRTDTASTGDSWVSFCLCCRRRDKTSQKEENNAECSNTHHVKHNYRILVFAIAISMTYLLSYAPHFCVMFYLFGHDASVFSTSSQNLVFELLMRSFFLNNILNPVIYGLLSQEFRRELRRLHARFTKSCCPC
ncbi:neuropeptide s receptor [Plakobranchus ocellatus]|uniref:Neuropeptide s receptor n=1 Tax=Plakobranchus ocellatus TaxID=259542 RepID=A0AAV4AP41_9GAST|nr:neuropeptide s receptor [Plakobranchus ocellatus]